MPPKRRKFESTFPAARIKKIMQLDDDVGRVASSVPIVISRAVEIFLQAMLTKSSEYATSRNAKTLTVGHIKHCIENEKQWDFLKDLTAKVPDVTACNENEGSPKRGRKRKTSDSSKPAASVPGKKRVKKTDEDEDSQTDEESDTSSPGSSHSLTLLQKSKTNEPSPLAILQRHLSSGPLSPGTTVASTTQSNISPLTALAAGLQHSTTHSDVAPSVKATVLPSSLNTTISPLLAYASSISQPTTISKASPPLPTTEQNLSVLTNLGQIGRGSGGCHDNNEDEDYDA